MSVPLEVIIEISSDSQPVKYEMDAEGNLQVDRFLPVSMVYPCCYGYVPGTLADDGDALDVLVLTRCAVQPGASIKVRPIGVLLMEDEAGEDSKVLSVPISRVDAYYDHVKDIKDINKSLLDRIVHFFEHYKDLEEAKMSKVRGWAGIEDAQNLVKQATKQGV